MNSIASKIQSAKNLDEELSAPESIDLISFENSVKMLYGKLSEGKPENSLTLEILSSCPAVKHLSEWLFEYGVGKGSNAAKQFLAHYKPSQVVPFKLFEKDLREEWNRKHLMAWVAEIDLLRCIVDALPKSSGGDPLSGLKALSEKESVEKIVERMTEELKKILWDNIQILNSPNSTPRQCGLDDNSELPKFGLDPELFTMK